MAFNIKLPPVYSGAAYTKIFRWYTVGTDNVRVPVDLSGMNGRIQLRDGAGDLPIYADWSTANGKLVFDDVNRITIHVPRSETLTYQFDHARWDFLLWPTTNIDLAELVMHGSIDGPETVTDLTP